MKRENEYRDCLDDAYGVINIAGGTYNTSYVLKEADSIAYVTGYWDWLDANYPGEEE